MYDFDSLSEKQLEVLGQITIGNDTGHHPKTIESLLKKGMIESEIQVLKDRFGDFKIARYFMPIHVHIRWCEWCSLNYSEEDE